MNKIIPFLLFFCCFLIKNGFSQTLDEWVGTYEGNMIAQNSSGTQNEFKMRLDIQKVNDSIYDWTITYGENGQDIRPYQLTHKKENSYEMDEKNSIVLKATKFGNELISVFDVQGSLLWVSYTLIENAIEVKITSSINRGVTGNEGDIPEVGTYGTVANQTGTLQKLD